MSSLFALFDQVQSLSAMGCRVKEESFRITLEHPRLDQIQAEKIGAVFKSCADLSCFPTLMIDGEQMDPSDLASSFGESWMLVIGKSELAKKHLKLRPDEQTFLFFSTQGFDEWSKQLSPFSVLSSPLEPDFNRPVTIRVHGLASAFGGDSLWVMPADIKNIPSPSSTGLPENDVVHKLVHLVSLDQAMRVSPRNWALTWGNLQDAQARQWMRLSCLVLSACLVSEIKNGAPAMQVTVRGAKSHTLGLWQSHADLPWHALQLKLLSAVQWVYAERSETRLKLLMDRLSVDINPAGCWLTELHRLLDAALKQAQDSYAFVILDRKDAYFKEMREVMKDMKSQADLYAAKVRELVSTVTRDILGVLAFLGFSFIGRFDQQNLDILLRSSELSLLLKALSGYLLLSCALQLTAHWRDASLAYAESTRWLDVLQNYTSQSDRKAEYIEPIDKRRKTLCIAMFTSAALYALVAGVVWNLPFVIKWLLVP